MTATTHHCPLPERKLSDATKHAYFITDNDLLPTLRSSTHVPVGRLPVPITPVQTARVDWIMMNQR